MNQFRKREAFARLNRALARGKDTILTQHGFNVYSVTAKDLQTIEKAIDTYNSAGRPLYVSVGRAVEVSTSFADLLELGHRQTEHAHTRRNRRFSHSMDDAAELSARRTPNPPAPMTGAVVGELAITTPAMICTNQGHTRCMFVMVVDHFGTKKLDFRYALGPGGSSMTLE
ncbi:hypothetical protein G7Z17_g2369 [Cylindrodendrum hubeiense]|uniref:Uncharacterized protein n=1 Tax=Cylindrodendrum hubeiense TaxID=595255 RepID=A0A9P5LBN9_9HYPO|nr:hypothetical protein G7Z17_g2369 [Cylindrodendrum hubeiense]